eukprot:c19550_g1_i1.p1 GENE.c19550_g1_i1~~c19550_g1_i1.p1  ORF type:complete len:563 (-),score=220.09 c19550_g1_i1:36-1724(-)
MSNMGKDIKGEEIIKKMSDSKNTSSSSSTDFIEVSKEELNMIHSDDEDDPVIQYARLGSNAQEILKSDKCTAFSTAHRFIALGTSSGLVHLLDFHGNQIRRFKCHLSAVTDISFDISFEYMATSSNDGSVAVFALYDEHNPSPIPASEDTTPLFQLLYSSPVVCIAIDPKFKSSFNNNVCIGCLDGNLYMNSPGWLRGRKDNTLSPHQGTMSCVRWSGPYVAWANEKGVKIYNYKTSQRLGFVKQTHSENNQNNETNIPKCHLFWETESTLMIAWGKKVKILAIQEKKDSSHLNTEEQVVLLHAFTTEYLVCGVVSLNQFLVLLTFQENSSESLANLELSSDQNHAGQPVLRVVTRDCVELACDVLAITNTETFGPNDFRLDGIYDGLCFVSSPKEIIAVDMKNWIIWASSRYAQFTPTPHIGSNEILWKREVGGEDTLKLVMTHAFEKCLTEPLLADWLSSSGQRFWRDCASTEERRIATVDFVCFHLRKYAGESFTHVSIPPTSPLTQGCVFTEKPISIFRYHILKSLDHFGINSDTQQNEFLALINNAIALLPSSMLKL